MRGCVAYERRTLTAGGLSEVATTAAVGLRVEALVGELIAGTAVTGDDGCFAVAVAGETDGVTVVVSTSAHEPDTSRAVLAVAPGDDSSSASHEADHGWRWSSDGEAWCGLAPRMFTPTSDGALVMSPLLVTEACGAGAIAAFETIGRAMRCLAPAQTGEALPSVAVFWSPGVKSDCGACYFGPGEGAASIGGEAYDTRIVLSGRDDIPSHWAPSVLAHEVGHWAMDALSRSPSAQGAHYLTAPSSPGLAYKEGWATAFGQRCLGGDPVYRAMQAYAVVSVDLRSLASSAGVISLPSPGQGLDQPINEFVVASALWRFWTSGPPGDASFLGRGDGAVVGVLGSERLRGGSDRGFPGLDLVDFLDAAVCEGHASSADVAAMLAPLQATWSGPALCDGSEGAGE